MFDFSSLIDRYGSEILIHVETSGGYDYSDGGVWKAESETRSATAAVFNLTSRDINSAIQYNEGGFYTKNDVKIYIREQLPIGTKLTHKGRRYTVSTELDHSAYAHGLRIYIAKGADG